MHDAASSNTVRRSVLAVGGSYGSLPQVVGLSPDWVHEERHVGHFCNFGSSHAGGARGPVLTDASVASRSQLPVGQMALYEKQKSCSTAPIPPHSEGALRAIVTTREAGSGGREVFAAGSKSMPTNECLADVKSQRPDTPMLVSRAVR